jgi:hypothetical protein
MNKPITESNFIALIQEHQLDRDITVGKMGEHYFELAKRMAIDFAKWIREKGYEPYFAIKHGEKWIEGTVSYWIDSNCHSITEQQLFELYQQQK